MNKIIHKLASASNKIRRYFNNKEIIVFIGKKGVKVIAYDKKKNIDSIFVYHDDAEKIKRYKNFLKKYKSFDIYFLLNNKECHLKHEFIPAFETIIKSNPIEKFIEENYNPENIIAYSIYNIDRTNGETFETILAVSEYSKQVRQLLEFVIYNGFNFGGAYFLALEFESIIESILARKNIYDCQDDLQVLVTITEASGIHIAIKHNKNILNEIVVEFPEKKSAMYIVGTIEQGVSDALLQYKGYINSLELRICLILLCDQNLCDLLKKVKSFEKFFIVTYNTNNDSKEQEADDIKYNQGELLFETFSSNRQYLAVNELLSAISKFTAINSIAFKPLVLIVIIIIGIIFSFKYQTILNERETKILNNQYYSLSEQYRNIKKRHPNVENVTNLADLYNYQNILAIESRNPFSFLKILFSIDPGEVKITNVIWDLKQANILDKKEELIVSILYEDNKNNMEVINQKLAKYLTKVKKAFVNYKITYIKNMDSITKLPKKTILPATIIISEK